MPCDQIVRTHVMATDTDLLKKVVASVAKARNAKTITAGNLGLGMHRLSNQTLFERGPAGALQMRGYDQEVMKQVQVDFADALLIKAMKNIDFYLEKTEPMRPEVAKELGAGSVEHTFVGMGEGGKKVTIGRAPDGRLHFEFAGYSEHDAQELANRITQSMNSVGLKTDDLHIKQDTEKWLEETLPDRLTEKN